MNGITQLIEGEQIKLEKPTSSPKMNNIKNSY